MPDRIEMPPSAATTSVSPPDAAALPQNPISNLKAAASTPAADVFLNVHGTLLTLDNGRGFPRGGVMRLTPAEVARFKRAEAATKQRLIVPHPGPPHNAT